jgi:hypothetical protein
MKGFITGFLMVALASGALAGGAWSTTYALQDGAVAVTNTQANSVWVPVAVLWKFSSTTNATVTIERVSQGNTFALGSMTATNAASAIWLPEADYPFGVGDVLRVMSTATGAVQVIRKGE